MRRERGEDKKDDKDGWDGHDDDGDDNGDSDDENNSDDRGDDDGDDDEDGAAGLRVSVIFADPGVGSVKDIVYFLPSVSSCTWWSFAYP